MPSEICGLSVKAHLAPLGDGMRKAIISWYTISRCKQLLQCYVQSMKKGRLPRLYGGDNLGARSQISLRWDG